MSGGASATRSSLTRRRWYVPTANKFLALVLVMQGFLFLSAQYGWFWFNQYKGHTVLITVAATVVLLVLLVAWVLVSRLFRAKMQFSLATLLLVVPVLAIPCGWFARERELAAQQDAFFEHLFSHSSYRPLQDNPYDVYEPRSVLERYLQPRLGHAFFYDLSYVSINDGTDADVLAIGRHTKMKSLSLDDCILTDVGVAHLNRLQGVPQIRIRLRTRGPAGVRYLKGLRRVTSIMVDDRAVTDGDLENFQGLSELKNLFLEANVITDRGLAHLEGLTRLQCLYLQGTRITDEGLKHLSGMTNLQVLRLDKTGITNNGLQHLAGLTRLESLGLNETGVTEDGCQHLQGLTHLNELMLDRTEVSDVGPLARHLARVPLKRLSLSKTSVSDEGLEGIGKLAQLEWLNLSQTKVTDAGLPHLQSLKRLAELDLDHNAITDAGIETLERLVRLKKVEAAGTKVTWSVLNDFSTRNPILRSRALGPGKNSPR
jgi:Leucine-rich repeat (LRR) protein